MNKFSLISSILRRAWLIDPTWASNNIGLIADVIKGKMVDFGQGEKRDDTQRVAVLSKEAANLYAPSYYSGFDKAPEGSIALIDVIGPVMKYGFCSDGSYEMNQQVQQAKNSPNIKGLFANIDSPGGQVDGTATFANSIKNFGKPTLAFINDGMMASAATWIGTSAMELYASQPLDSVGSIGVYQTIYDQRERLKMMGIKSIDRYAPQSTEKNKSYKDALKGNFDQIDEELFAICELFINTISENRGNALKGDPEDWNKGQLGFATWAQSIGLIDGITSFENAIDRLDELCNGATPMSQMGTAPKTSINNKNNNMKLTNVIALGNVEEPTDEQIDKANADLTGENITAVTLVRESFIQEAADATKLAGELSTKVETLESAAVSQKTELDTANATIATNATTIADLNAKVEAFGKNAGANHQSSGGEDTPPEGENDLNAVLDNLAHNKTADAMLP